MIGISGFSQKLDIKLLLSVLNEPFHRSDSILLNNKFTLADKETGDGYFNYYYTSYEKADKKTQLLRSLSIMDVFNENDTSRLILYRTYSKKDQEDLASQLRTSGFEITKRNGNDFIYQNEKMSITNKVNEKTTPGGEKVMVYEFELGR